MEFGVIDQKEHLDMKLSFITALRCFLTLPLWRCVPYTTLGIKETLLTSVNMPKNPLLDDLSKESREMEESACADKNYCLLCPAYRQCSASFKIKDKIGDGPQEECPESGIDDTISHKRASYQWWTKVHKGFRHLFAMDENNPKARRIVLQVLRLQKLEVRNCLMLWP